MAPVLDCDQKPSQRVEEGFWIYRAQTWPSSAQKPIECVTTAAGRVLKWDRLAQLASEQRSWWEALAETGAECVTTAAGRVLKWDRLAQLASEQRSWWEALAETGAECVTTAAGRVLKWDRLAQLASEQRSWWEALAETGAGRIKKTTLPAHWATGSSNLETK